MHHCKAAPARRFSISTLALAAMLAGALALGGCGPVVLVKDFKLENTTIGISKNKPLNVRIEIPRGQPFPSKEESAQFVRRADAFVNDVTGPLTRDLKAGLQQSNVKVFDSASTYRIVRFMRGMKRHVQSNAKSKAMLKALKAREDASGKADQQPDMMLNVFFRDLLTYRVKGSSKDPYTLSIQAAVVTLKGPGEGIGPVWKQRFTIYVDADRTNNEAVANEIASKVLKALKEAKIIS